MGFTRSLMTRRAVACLAVFSLTVPALTAADLSTKRARIRIDNFGRINDSYFRGAQPKDQDYADLAAFGIRTVIDLTKGGRSEEQGMVEHAGMKFYRIPMTTSDRPSDEAVTRFLAIVNDPVNQPVFVHCQGGRHRTGVMTAVYRITQDGWSADRAYEEMRQFRFEGFPGHPTLKRFVYDFDAGRAKVRVAQNGQIGVSAAAAAVAIPASAR